MRASMPILKHAKHGGKDAHDTRDGGRASVDLVTCTLARFRAGGTSGVGAHTRWLSLGTSASQLALDNTIALHGLEAGAG